MSGSCCHSTGDVDPERLVKDIFSLKDKTVLITGGYGHLGRATAVGLADHGASVVVLGRSEEKFRSAFDDSKRQITFQTCDMSRSESIRAAFKSVAAAVPRIDVLINNAFYSRGNDPEKLSDDDWAYGIDGTLSSVYRAIREIIPYFHAQRGGKIIYVSSMYGLVAPRFSIYEAAPGQLNPPHYGAAKAGVIQLTRYYAAYLGPSGVNVNCVVAGPFPTPATQANGEFVEALKSMNPLGRIGTPEGVVGAFVFLSSSSSDFVTGHNLVVDGGWTAW